MEATFRYDSIFDSFAATAYSQRGNIECHYYYYMCYWNPHVYKPHHFSLVLVTTKYPIIVSNN